ncbi:hypothetical protein GCM10010449_76640 [Streptomyces rectiviolaceus]|uniref:Uncharacterized protein n=1 Tax=Streptomyces rectiviolaceus TaxID=332591 RepID=A0ABP6NEZ8_9ACTN
MKHVPPQPCILSEPLGFAIIGHAACVPASSPELSAPGCVFRPDRYGHGGAPGDASAEGSLRAGIGRFWWLLGGGAEPDDDCADGQGALILEMQ